MNSPVQRKKRKTIKKRDADQDQAESCKNMNLAASVADTAANLAGDAGTASGAIPLLGIPFVIGFAAVSAANHLASGVLNIAIIEECSSNPSTPPTMRKNTTNQQFDEINRKLDETATELAELSEKERHRREVEGTEQGADNFLVSSKLKKEYQGLINHEKVNKLTNYYLLDSPVPRLAHFKSQLRELCAKVDEKMNLYKNHINKSAADLVGFMFLIDVLRKKMNKQTYKFFGGDIKTSMKEARADALNLTNSFEEFLKTFSKFMPSEHIDLSMVYSDILRAVVSNNVNKLPEILRSYSELFTDIETNAFETFLKDNALAYPANKKA